MQIRLNFKRGAGPIAGQVHAEEGRFLAVNVLDKLCSRTVRRTCIPHRSSEPTCLHPLSLLTQTIAAEF